MRGLVRGLRELTINAGTTLPPLCGRGDSMKFTGTPLLRGLGVARLRGVVPGVVLGVVAAELVSDSESAVLCAPACTLSDRRRVRRRRISGVRRECVT